MAITVELGIGQIITVPRDSATIGQDPACDVCIPNSPKIQPVHARIVKVVNRWMIQSEGDWLLKVGDGVPGRKLWLNPGDMVHLSESGPYLVFEPKQAATTPLAKPVPPAEPSGVPLAQPMPPAANVPMPAKKAETESSKTTLPPFLQPIRPATTEKPAEKPKKPQPSKHLDEEDEVWEDVYGYWMDEKQK
jgi:hypothetical protein